MIAYVRLASITITSTWPTGSTRRARSALDSGTKSAHRTTAAIPTGMLIQKIARQPIEPTSPPPITGPSARLMPTTPPHTPMALARSRGSVNVFVMIDIATGFSIEPPTACSIRKAISQPSDGASEHSSDARVKISRPSWKMRRRPSRSAVDPESISRLASTSV